MLYIHTCQTVTVPLVCRIRRRWLRKAPFWLAGASLTCYYSLFYVSLWNIRVNFASEFCSYIFFSVYAIHAHSLLDSLIVLAHPCTPWHLTGKGLEDNSRGSRMTLPTMVLALVSCGSFPWFLGYSWYHWYRWYRWCCWGCCWLILDSLA